MNMEEIEKEAKGSTPTKRSEVVEALQQSVSLVVAMADGLALQDKETDARIMYAIAGAYEICAEMVSQIEVLD